MKSCCAFCGEEQNQKKGYIGWAPVPPASESPEFKHGSEDKE